MGVCSCKNSNIKRKNNNINSTHIKFKKNNVKNTVIDELYTFDKDSPSKIKQNNNTDYNNKNSNNVLNCNSNNNKSKKNNLIDEDESYKIYNNLNINNIDKSKKETVQSININKKKSFSINTNSNGNNKTKLNDINKNGCLNESIEIINMYNEIKEKIKKNNDNKTIITPILSRNEAKNNNLKDFINNNESNRYNLFCNKIYNNFINEISPFSIYKLVKYHLTNEQEYSSEIEYNSILKKSKTFSKSVLSLKLLVLKERPWIKELIENSDFIKYYRDITIKNLLFCNNNNKNIEFNFLDKPTIIKYINQRIKITEHFNSITWAISYFYYSVLYSDQSQEKVSVFKHDEFFLPPVDSLEWINGFEWKGLFIRIYPESESHFINQEISNLKKLFIEYLQIIELNPIKNNIDLNNNLLSNNIVFPLISAVKIYGIYIVATVIIPSINAEESRLFCYYDKNLDNNNNSSILNNEYTNNYIDKNDIINDSKFYKYFLSNYSDISKHSEFNNTNNGEIQKFKKSNNLNHIIAYNNKLQYSSFSMDNTYRHINFPNLKYIKDSNSNVCTTDNSDLLKSTLIEYNISDLKSSYLFKNINKDNLIKISDNCSSLSLNNDENKKILKLKTKYMLINTSNLIPDLIKKDIKNSVNLLIPESSKSNIEAINNENTSSLEAIKNLFLKVYPNNCKEYDRIFKNITKLCNKTYLPNNLNTYDKNMYNLFQLSNIMFNQFDCSNLNDSYYSILNSSNLISTKTNINYSIIHSNDISFSLNNINCNYYNNLHIKNNKYSNEMFINSTKEESSKLKNKEKQNFDFILNANNNQDNMFIRINERINNIIYYAYNNNQILDYSMFNNITKDSYYKKLSNINNVLEFKKTLLKLCNNNSELNTKDNKNNTDIKTNNNINRIINPIIYNNKSNNVNNNQLYQYTNSNMSYTINNNNNITSNYLLKNPPLSEIKGPCILTCNLKDNIKLGYSVIPPVNFINNKLDLKQLILTFDFNFHLEKVIKILNFKTTIENTIKLNDFLCRYSIPLEIKYFLIPRIKLSKISDIIKIDFLTDLIMNSLLYQEGLNFISKMLFINYNNNIKPYDIAIKENLNVIYDGFYPFIKEKSLMNIYKEKVYQSILCILATSKCQQSFYNFFFEQLNLNYFLELNTLRVISNYLSKSNVNNLYNELFNKDYTNIFIKNCILSANDRPFLFLSTLESKLQITIDPYIKFKASISKDQFIDSFTASSILESEFKPQSFINTKEMVEYIYTDLSPLEEDLEDEFPDIGADEGKINIGPKIAKQNKFDNIKNKLNKQNINYIKVVKAKNFRKYPINENNKNGNSLYNNISNNSIEFPENSVFDAIKKNANTSNINNKSNCLFTNFENNINNNSTIKSNIGIINDKDALFNKLFYNLDLDFSSVLYKLKTSASFYNNINKIDIEAKSKFKLKTSNILKYKYTFNKSNYLKDWRNRIDYLLNDVYSINQTHAHILNILYLLFLNSFFLDKDIHKSKNFLNAMFDFTKNNNSCNYLEDFAIINLFQALTVEKYNYIESESYYSKCIMFSLILMGDPRGKGSYGSYFNIVPFWKLARQTNVLENFNISENFKELFYCQEFTNKTINNILKNYIKEEDNFEKNYLEFYSKDYKLFNNTSLGILNKKFNNVNANENNNKKEEYFDYYCNMADSSKIYKFEDKYHSSFFNFLYDDSLRYYKPSYTGLVINLFDNNNLCNKLLQNINEKENIQNMSNISHDNTKIINLINLNNKSSAKCNFNINCNNNQNYTTNNNISYDQCNIDEGVLNNNNNFIYSSNINSKFENCADDNNNYNNLNKSESSDKSVFWFIDENYIKEDMHNILFPSISNVNSKCKNILNSKEFAYCFINWILKFSFNRSNSLYTDEFIINKLNMELLKCNDNINNTINPTSSSFRSNFSNIKNNVLNYSVDKSQNINNQSSNIFDNLRENSILAAKQNLCHKNKNQIVFNNNIMNKKVFSNVLYDIILKKLSFKNVPPKGFILSFGCNKHNQTSHNNYKMINYPRLCYKLKEDIIDKVSCGWEHTIALTRSKSLYSWGNNSSGQCGITKIFTNNKIFFNNKNDVLKDVLNVYNPMKIKHLSTNIVNIACGNDYSIALDSLGYIYSWGKNEGGVLGYGSIDISQLNNIINNSINNIEYLNNANILNSKNNNAAHLELNKKERNKDSCSLLDINPIPKIILSLSNIKYIACGSLNNLVINNKHKVYSWGSGEGGQLGHTENILLKNSNQTGCLTNPLIVESLENLNIVKVSSGEAHSIALSNNGEVYGWGFNYSGQLGIGFCADSFEPGTGINYTRLFTPKKIQFVSVKNDEINSLNNNKIYNHNKNSEINNNTNKFNSLLNSKYISNIINLKNSIFDKKNLINSNNNSFTNDEINNKLNINKKSITKKDLQIVTNIQEQPIITDIVCGKTYTYFLDINGILYCCGANDYGQLGIKNISYFTEHLHDSIKNGSNFCYDIIYPLKLDIFSKMKVKKISCGDSHTLAIILDVANNITSIWSWGYNKYGQLGQGKLNEIGTPKPISYLLNYEGCRIVDVVCGGNHSICLLSNFCQVKSNVSVSFIIFIVNIYFVIFK